MKIAYCSDLHLDIDPNAGFPDSFIFPDADILILAGDIAQVCFLRTGSFDLPYAKNFRNFLERASAKYNHILWIPGNHEFYDSSFKDAPNIVNAYFKEVGIDNVLYGETISHIVGEYIFIGATLWTDVNCGNPLAIMNSNMMNDYKYIDAGTFTVHDGIKKHYEHKEFIYSKITNHNSDSKNTIVFTHHAPHYKSSVDVNAFTPFYCCTDMEDIIQTGSPKLWIHGHTHHQTSYNIFNTQVLSNPRGYYGSDSLANYFKIEVIQI
jgi:Icc-related predicted phosphoesterase